MATFCSCEESYSEISCVIVRGEVYAMATTSILPENGKTPRCVRTLKHYFLERLIIARHQY